MSTSALLACMIAVSQLHQLPPRILPAIWATEGGRIGTVRANANGTEDLGLMQVNSVWLPALARGTGLPQAELRRRLIEDGCFSIAVAGAILRFHVEAERGDLMRAIGNYHSRTPGLHEAYRVRVEHNAARLFGGGTPARSPGG
jgi:hypothetical protein